MVRSLDLSNERIWSPIARAGLPLTVISASPGYSVSTLLVNGSTTDYGTQYTLVGDEASSSVKLSFTEHGTTYTSTLVNVEGLKLNMDESEIGRAHV